MGENVLKAKGKAGSSKSARRRRPGGPLTSIAFLEPRQRVCLYVSRLGRVLRGEERRGEERRGEEEDGVRNLKNATRKDGTWRQNECEKNTKRQSQLTRGLRAAYKARDGVSGGDLEASGRWGYERLETGAIRTCPFKLSTKSPIRNSVQESSYSAI